MNVLVLTRYSNLGSSSRLRFYQYLKIMNSSNIQTTVSPLFNDEYLNQLYFGKVSYINVLMRYFKRLIRIANSRDFDLVWLEKEALPWFPGWLEIMLLPKSTKLVIDFDDAVYHRYDKHSIGLIRKLLGKKIDIIMNRANLVVAGNEYIATRAKEAFSKWVEILPTVVDTDRYKYKIHSSSSTILIGWIGSPSTVKFVHSIAPALIEIKKIRDVNIVLIGANDNQISGLPVTTEPWSEETEVECIQKIDIGIMPLIDEHFERGKCGYKLIQYMACGKPVIATPVGVNCKIVDHDVNGFLASTTTEWVIALTKLIDQPDLRKRMGVAGYNKVKKHYSLDVTAKKYINHFSKITNFT